MKIIARIIAILFDLDGLLLKTETTYDKMFFDFWKKFGKTELTNEAFNAMRAKQFGAGTEQSARILLEACGLPVNQTEIDHYLSWREEYNLNSKFQNTEAFDGAKQLVTSLKQAGVPIALATSSSLDLLQAKTTNHPWLPDAFGRHIVTSDIVKNKKPDPEAFIKAASTLDITPDQYNQVLVIEDAPNGIQAACAAGMHTIAIPDPRLSKPEEQLAGADQILTSLTEIDLSQWGINLS